MRLLSQFQYIDISGRIIRQLKTSISSDAIQSVNWDGKSAEGIGYPMQEFTLFRFVHQQAVKQ